MDLGISDRVAVVTGASKGIGRAVALQLSAERCRTVLCARDRKPLDDVAKECVTLGGQPFVYDVDVTDASAAEAIVAATVAEFGQLDILVNNAGGAAPGQLGKLSDDDWRAGFELNFFAPVRLAMACVPVMTAGGWGRIINVCSTAAIEPEKAFAPYSAAKAALMNVSKAFALEYSKSGILSNCVTPGTTITETVESNARSSAASAGTTYEAVMSRVLDKQRVATGRLGVPGEIAAAIVFLASEQSRWIAGANLVVDGGTLRAM